MKNNEKCVKEGLEKKDKKVKIYGCTGDKYYNLRNYLYTSNKDVVKLTFEKIEEILGFKLGKSSRTHRADWSNTYTISLPCAWMNIGYKTTHVDMEKGEVTFEKSNIKFKNYINDVAICGNDARREAITNILKELDIKYEIVGKTTKNIVVSFNKDNELEKKIVVGAHYDAHDKTCPGANDNGAGCVILLNLIEELKETNLKLDFVFFDKEEQGGIGSREYIENVGRENIKGMINLDMCGLGSNIMVNPYDLGTDIFNEYPFKKIVKDAPNILPLAPGGDSTIFMMNNIPAIMIFNSTDNDLEWFKDFAKGKAPNGITDFSKTMHQDTDTADKFDATGMEMIYRYLLNHLKK